MWRTVLLLFVPLLAAAATVPAQAVDEEPIDEADPAGDVTVAGQGSLSHLKMVDLRGLRVEMSESEMLLQVEFEDLDGPQHVPESAFWYAGYMTVRVEFALERQSEVEYRLEITCDLDSLPGYLTNYAMPPLRADNCRGYGLEVRNGTHQGRWDVALQERRTEGRDTFLVRVPLSLFWQMPRGDPVPGLDKAMQGLEPGDRFVGFRATSRGSAFLSALAFQDEVSAQADKGLPWKEFLNYGIRFVLPTGQAPLAVAPSTNHTLSFGVHNPGATKRLVQIDYEALGENHGLRVFGPKSVAVPAKQVRNYTFWIETGATVPPAGTELLLTGKALGTGDRAVERRPVLAGFTLGPDKNRLDVRVRWEGNPVFVPGITCVDPLTTPGYFSCISNATLTHDPSSSSPEAEEPFVTDGFAARTPMQVAQPLALAAKQPTVVELAFRATVAAIPDVRVTARLKYCFTQCDSYYSTEAQAVVFLDRETTDQIETTPTVLKLQAVPRAKVQVLPANGFFRLDIDLFRPLGGGGPGNIEFLPKESSIKLPLAEIPPEYRTSTTPTRFQLSPLNDLSDFVNPGKAHLFKVGVLNFDSAEQRVRLSATTHAPGWLATVRPGETFDLGPGESVTAGVLAEAPADAPEGQTATFWFNATDDQGVATSLRLSLTALNEIEFEDERDKFVADQDDLEKLATEAPPKTPGFELLLLVAAVIFLIRRRP